MFVITNSRILLFLYNFIKISTYNFLRKKKKLLVPIKYFKSFWFQSWNVKNVLNWTRSFEHYRAWPLTACFQCIYLRSVLKMKWSIREQPFERKLKGKKSNRIHITVCRRLVSMAATAPLLPLRLEPSGKRFQGWLANNTPSCSDKAPETYPTIYFITFSNH